MLDDNSDLRISIEPSSSSFFSSEGIMMQSTKKVSSYIYMDSYSFSHNHAYIAMLSLALI